MDSFEKELSVLFESEHFIQDDNEDIVPSPKIPELSEEDLELVSAAATPSYQSLLSRINKENE